MTVQRGVIHRVDHFDRPLTLTTTPEGGTGWTLKDTSSAGSPTAAAIAEDGGALKLTLANTDEAEILTLYHNDTLVYDLAKLQHLWWILKVAGIDANTVLAAGLGSEQADDEDTMDYCAWFKLEGAASTSLLVVETDDKVNNNDDVATSVALASVYKKCHIDLTDGLDNVRFFVDGMRVADSVKFDMSDLEAGHNVQPFVQLSKASGTGTPSVTIAQFGVQYELAYGA